MTYRTSENRFRWYQDGRNFILELYVDESEATYTLKYTVRGDIFREISKAALDEMGLFNKRNEITASGQHLKDMVQEAETRFEEKCKRDEEKRALERENQRKIREAEAAKAELQRQEERRRAELQRQTEEREAEQARQLQLAEESARIARAENECLAQEAAKRELAAKKYYSNQFSKWDRMSRGDMLQKLSGMPRPLRQIPRVAIIGRTNAGKTTLINTLYGLELQTSATENTMGKEVVCCSGGLEVVDTFGYNDGRSYYTADMAEYFLSVDRVVVAYAESIDGELDVLQLVEAAGCEIMVVRSKCDTLSREDIMEIKAYDEAKLGSKIGWLAVSSRSKLGVDVLVSWLSSTRPVVRMAMPSGFSCGSGVCHIS